MKNRIYILSVILLLLNSCMDSTLDTIINNDRATEVAGKEIVYGFSIHIPEHNVVATRSGATITDMQLLVFDENGRFLSRNKAIMEATQTIDGVVVRNFKVTLLSSNTKRYIHFIANYDNWDNFPDTHEILYMDEGSVVPRINSKTDGSTVNTAYWNRFEFDNLEETSFDNKRFPLLRNSARIELVNEAYNFDVHEFAVYNAPSEGTVAPFKYDEANNTFSFAEGTLTEVSPVDLIDPHFVDYNTTEYIDLFERDNQVSEKKVFIIIKASLNGTEAAYFKLDVMKDKESGILYDIFRNRIYRFIIESVAANGYSTPEAAAMNPAANNVLGSVELIEYPSISDGTSFLRIEKSAEVFIQPKTFVTQIDYFRYLTTDVTSPGIVSVDWLGDAPSDGTTFNYDKATGKLTVTVTNVPTDRVYNYTLKVSTDDTAVNGVFRYITLRLRAPYDFNFNLVSETTRVNIGTSRNPIWVDRKPQNNAVTITFNVPGTIPSNVFPIPILFKTKEIYPDPAKKDLKVDILNNEYRYEYIIKESNRGQTVTLDFKRTYSDRTEDIEVICNYIKQGTIIRLD